MIQPFPLGTSVTRIDGGNIATGTILADNAIIPGSIGVGLLNANAIVTNSIFVKGIVDSINGNVGGTQIDGASISTGTVNTARLNASAIVSAINGQATTINGNKITTGSLTAASGLFDFITAGKIQAGYLDISGVVSVMNGGSVTKITGNGIATGTITAANLVANTITTAQLNFTPVTGSAGALSTQVIASINASSEGIRIAGANIAIDGNVTFTGTGPLQTSINTAQTNATNASASDATTKANAAQAAATAAAAADATIKANAAGVAGAAAKAITDDITNDDALAAGEKQSLKPLFDGWVAEQSGIDSQATSFSITTEKTNYDTALSTLVTYINTTKAVFSSMTVTTQLGAGGGATMRSYVSDMLNKKQILLTKIASQANALAVTAAAADATTKANNAQSGAVSTAATDAQSRATTAYNNAVSAASTALGVVTSNIYQSGTTQINGGTIYTGTVAATSLAASLVITSVIQSASPAWQAGTNSVGPVGFKLSGNAFTTTFIGGATDANCQFEIGGSVNIAGYKAATLTNKVMNPAAVGAAYATGNIGASATVMGGAKIYITMATSTRLMLLQGQGTTTGTATGTKLVYGIGTGNAPNAGAAAVGSSIPYGSIITGLTIGTTYWVDIQCTGTYTGSTWSNSGYIYATEF